jgi:signal peptidase
VVVLTEESTNAEIQIKDNRLRVGPKEIASLVILMIVVLLVVNIGLRELTGTPSPIAVVRGNSMYPLLREGDIIILSKKSPNEIKVGDIIVYRSLRGSLIVHRVIEVEYVNGIYYFKTKGDNNILDDKFLNEYEDGLGINQNRVVGVAIKMGDSVLKIPYLGSIALILSGR